MATDAATEHVTLVSAPLDVCHLVPPGRGRARNPFGGYRVSCAPDRSGTLSFCGDATCAGACNTTAFTAAGCLASDAAFGAASLRVDCFAATSPALLPAAPPVAPPHSFTATWFAGDSCLQQGRCPAGHYTVVAGPEGLAMTVPDSPAHAFMVLCSQSGAGGLFLTCDDAVCTTVATRTPFASGGCLPNPAQYGARSVVFSCGNGSVPDALVLSELQGGAAASFGPAPLSRLQPRSGAGATALSAAAALLGVGAAVCMLG